jgi:hypothetical protein
MLGVRPVGPVTSSVTRSLEQGWFEVACVGRLDKRLLSISHARPGAEYSES